MKWIKKGDKFLLSRDELCTFLDWELCLEDCKEADRPCNFDNEDIVKIRRDMHKVLGQYMTKEYIRKLNAEAKKK